MFNNFCNCFGNRQNFCHRPFCVPFCPGPKPQPKPAPKPEPCFCIPVCHCKPHKPEPPKPPVCQRWCFEVICRPCAPLQNGPLAYDGKPELREDAKFDGYDGYDAKDDGAY